MLFRFLRWVCLTEYLTEFSVRIQEKDQVNVVLMKVRILLNNRSGDFTFYRSINESLTSHIFEKMNNGF